MNALTALDQGNLPAAFANRARSMNAAAQAGVTASFAIIGYKGRNWRIKHRGETTIVMDANRQPMGFLDVVIVGVAAGISKQWYDKSYTEGSDDAPDCFSTDGVRPDAGSPKKQCDTCAVCPRNIWGSKITEAGKKAKDCQDSRRLAVVPLGDLNNETYGGPMMLRIPPMSLNQLANYAGMLEQRGAGLEMVGTRLSFDWNVAYPLITFEPVRWLNDAEAQAVVGPDGNSGICAQPVIERMLAQSVEAATHDPATPPQNDPLAAGGPSQAFAGTPAVTHQPQQQAQPAPEPAPVQQVQQAAPAPQAQPQQQPTTGAAFGGAFGGAAQPQQQNQPVVQQQQPAPAQQVQQAAPAQQTPQQPAATATVQEAPADLQSAIDNLLSM